MKFCRVAGLLIVPVFAAVSLAGCSSQSVETACGLVPNSVLTMQVGDRKLDATSLENYLYDIDQSVSDLENQQVQGEMRELRKNVKSVINELEKPLSANTTAAMKEQARKVLDLLEPVAVNEAAIQQMCQS